MECPICAETYTKSVRKCIACPSCRAEACASCLKKFLTENTIEAKCMSCNVRWNMDFMRSSFSRAYMDTEYREHQINSMLAEADTRVSDFMEIIAQQKEYERREELRWREMKPLSDEQIGLKRKVWALDKQKKELQLRIRELEDQMKPIREKHRLIAEEAKKKVPERKKESFFMACPRVDCRGSVSTAYKCGLCAHFICADCHGDKGIVQDEGHECKKDDLDTVRLLKKNTKQCPKCHTGIFKTEGCDQMWCISCHTCFSWKSGEILNERVHNPHYYEYMRRVNGGVAPRNPGDLVCGGIPDIREVLRVAHLVDLVEHAEEIRKVSDFHRMIVHIQNVSIPPIQRRRLWNDTPNLNFFGAQYLQKKMTREEWGKILYKRTTELEQNVRFLDLFTMMTESGADLLRNYVGRKTDIGTTLRNVQALVDYANEQVIQYNKQFGKKRPLFNPALERYPF